MNYKVVLVLLALILAVPALAQAQSGGGYDLTWVAIAGGGVSTAAGSYQLTGTAGQPGAGALSGADYTLTGGFWGGAPTRYPVFLPLVIR